VASYRSQTEKWIMPRIGNAKLKDFMTTDAERFLHGLGSHLTRRSLVMIKSTLVCSIRRAQKHDLIGRNVAELADLPDGKPGHPSRAMTEQQAAVVLAAVSGTVTGYVSVVKITAFKQAATHCWPRCMAHSTWAPAWVAGRL
jgi:hypothetical protein